MCLLAATLGASWPDNVLTGVGPQPVAGVLAGLLPQGWAFFTRDPEASAIVPYRNESSGGWERVDTLPQSSPKNLLGLSRNERAQSTELALIANSLTGWTDCNDYLSACLGKAGSATAAALENPEPAPSFCGPVVLVEQSPVKWAYRDQVPESVRVSRYAVLDLACGSQP